MKITSRSCIVALTLVAIGCSGTDPTEAHRAASPTCDDRAGRSIEIELDLNMAGFNSSHAIVHLPPCYDTGGGSERYPVLYLLHGGGQEPEDWIEEPISGTEIADRLMLSGDIAPLILVLPPRSTKSTGFSETVLTPLREIVESRYRTVDDPSGRAIGGLSAGGPVAVTSAFGGEERFGAVGLLASAWSERTADQVIDGMSGRSDEPAVYVSVGDRDRFISHVPDIESVFAQLSIEPTIDIGSGGHDLTFFAENFESWLRWFDSQLSPETAGA